MQDFHHNKGNCEVGGSEKWYIRIIYTSIQFFFKPKSALKKRKSLLIKKKKKDKDIVDSTSAKVE